MLRGFRSVGDITFDLDGSVSADVGWVLFEVANSDPDAAYGIIGTYNHYATLLLLRTFHAERPCRIYGEFEDSANVARAWTLEDAIFIALNVYDVGGFIAFRAAASAHIH